MKESRPSFSYKWYFEEKSADAIRSSNISSATQLAVQEDSAVQQRMSKTSSVDKLMRASTRSFIASITVADTQLYQLPPIYLSSIGNNISGQAIINVTFNIQPPSTMIECPLFEKLKKNLHEFMILLSFHV